MRNRCCWGRWTWWTCGLLLCGAFARAADAPVLTWLDLDPGADLCAVRDGIKAVDGQILTLAPEGRLLVRWAPGKSVPATSIDGLSGMEPLQCAAPPAPPSSPPESLGWGRTSPEEHKALKADLQRVTLVTPNALARQRALLEGRKDRPSQVNNSLSQYFPFVGYQGSQGSCTVWAACYYWNTYTHTMDEDLDPSGVNADENQSSPAFLFNLFVEGSGGGADILEIMAGLRDLGCCSLARMPYDDQDQTTWPSEAAWIDALRRRTGTCRVIGSESGCTDEDLEAIKQHLANGNVAVVGLPVFTSWTGWTGQDGDGFNNGVLYANHGSSRGGHGLALAGYDDERPYFDGTTTRHGAFLLANAWGYWWGISNYPDTKWTVNGYLWAGYDYFKTANEGFDDNLGMAFFNDDLDDYRPQVYVVAGLNHAHRGALTFRAGIGEPGNPGWLSHAAFAPHYDLNVAIDDSRRVAIDLTDGVGAITDYDDVGLFAQLAVDGAESASATVSSADFAHDFDGSGHYEFIASDDPAVTVAPGQTGYAAVQFARGGLTVTPGTSFDEASGPAAPVSFSVSGPEGGPFTATQTYTLANAGAASLDWTVVTTPAWLDASSTSGTLAPGAETTVEASVGASAEGLPAGTYDGMLTVSDETSGNTFVRAVQFEIRPMVTFSFDVIPAAGPAGLPRALTVSASDIDGEVVRTFSGAATLTALAETDLTFVESGTSASWLWGYPLVAYHRNARAQVIHLAAEVGEAGLLTSVALHLGRVPEVPLRNWTIRVKHTSLSSYGSAVWENSGWTTVYRNHETITHTGWVVFPFRQPFAYNGSSNLMIDFSFAGLPVRGLDGWTYWANTDTDRVIIAYNDEIGADPLTWSSETSDPWAYNAAADIRLGRGVEAAIDRDALDGFSEGAWTGAVTLTEEARNVRLYADDGAGHTGASGWVGAYPGSDADGDGLSYEDETRDLDPGLPGIQNPFDPDVDDSTGDNGLSLPDGVPDGQNDWDGDGMSNADEFRWGYNPLDPGSYSMLPLTTAAGLCLLFLFIFIGVSMLVRRNPGREGVFAGR